VRIEEGEAKRNKCENLESLLQKKINSVWYPMQELEHNYPTTKGKVYRIGICFVAYSITGCRLSSVLTGSSKVDLPRNSSVAAIRFLV